MNGKYFVLALLLLNGIMCQNSPAIDILSIIEKSSCHIPGAKLTEVQNNVVLCAKRCGMFPWCVAMDYNLTSRQCDMFDQTCCSLSSDADVCHSNITSWPDEIRFPCGQNSCWSSSQICIPKSQGETVCISPAGELDSLNMTSGKLGHLCSNDADCAVENSVCEGGAKYMKCRCQCGYTYNASAGACVMGMRDCSFLNETFSNATSGVYTLDISTCDLPNRNPSTFCDMETDGGGWTLIQRRINGSLDFYRRWEEYKCGFGNPSSEFWLGNNIIHAMTSNYNFEIRFDLWSYTDEHRFAVYSDFVLGGEDDLYRLNYGTYSGDAGCVAEKVQPSYPSAKIMLSADRKDNILTIYCFSMHSGTGDALAFHKGRKFSTYDRDNDPSSINCAKSKHGAWWYGSCATSNLNGLYGPGPTAEHNLGLSWSVWLGNTGSLKRTEIKIRRVP